MTRATTKVGISRWRHFVSRFDWVLVAAIAAIVLIGLINLYSATVTSEAFDAHSEGSASRRAEYGSLPAGADQRIAVEATADGKARGRPRSVRSNSAKFRQQLIWVAIGATLFFLIALLDYRHLSRVAWVLLGLGGLAMVLLFVVEASKQHDTVTRRWLALGPIRVQPAELIKVAVIIAMARIVQDAELKSLSLKQRILYWGAVTVPALVVMLQNDLGTGLLILLMVVTVGYLVARNLRWLIAASIIGGATIPVAWHFDLIQKHHKDRIRCFVDADVDKRDKCYHTIQSIQAVGSGRLTGKGWHEGTQQLSGHLPKQWTDFPFAVWAEEWGFLGAVALLLLYAFLLLWTINNALMARDRFGSVICLGAAAMLFWQLWINVGMVLRLGPVVGMTLPFVSYGGSSLLTLFLAFGLVASVAKQRHGF